MTGDVEDFRPVHPLHVAPVAVLSPATAADAPPDDGDDECDDENHGLILQLPICRMESIRSRTRAIAGLWSSLSFRRG